jgi:hypothetical protein
LLLATFQNSVCWSMFSFNTAWTTDPWELTVADLTQPWVPSTQARLQECL